MHGGKEGGGAVAGMESLFRAILQSFAGTHRAGRGQPSKKVRPDSDLPAVVLASKSDCLTADGHRKICSSTINIPMNT